MYFTKLTFCRLPNGEYSVKLWASRKHYGNAIGVNRGVVLDETNKSKFALAKYVLRHHKRVK